MLSRVAERLYWLGRYLNRCENTARLIHIHTNLLLDMPKRVEVGWANLTRILGGAEQFRQRYAVADEYSVMRFLLIDTDNPGSLMASLNTARENLRTTREIMPSETWEQINEIYSLSRSSLDADLSRRTRTATLQTMVRAIERVWGIAEMNLRHDAAFHFLALGRAIEQADMTSRILDGAALTLMDNNQQHLQEFRSLLWMGVLRTLSSYQSYRQQVGNAVSGVDVLLFILRDPYFPRSVSASLSQLARIAALLPDGEDLQQGVTQLEQHLNEFDAENFANRDVHLAMDELQVHLAGLHTMLSASWFNHHTA